MEYKTGGLSAAAIEESRRRFKEKFTALRKSNQAPPTIQIGPQVEPEGLFIQPTQAPETKIKDIGIPKWLEPEVKE